MSQQIRKRIEEAFGWIKAAAGYAKIRGSPTVFAAPSVSLLSENYHDVFAKSNHT